jgi:hypothetical protein
MFDDKYSCYVCFIDVSRVACNLGSCVDCKYICIYRTPHILHFGMARRF